MGAGGTYHNITLPFVLDPSRDGLPVDGEYFVLAVSLEGDHGAGVVTAATTSQAASVGQSVAADPLIVDGHLWTGTASIISYRVAGSS